MTREETRECIKCHRVLPLSAYSKGGSAYRNFGGIMTQCKECWKAYTDEWHRKHPKKDGEYRRKHRSRIKRKHFFVWRARQWNHRKRNNGYKVTPEELVRIWRSQRGRCALSGRKLGRDAHLDHVTPISLGGSSGADNLRWTCPEINFVRGNLSDEELVRLCRDVAVWNG